MSVARAGTRLEDAVGALQQHGAPRDPNSWPECNLRAVELTEDCGFTPPTLPAYLHLGSGTRHTQRHKNPIDGLDPPECGPQSIASSQHHERRAR